MVVNVISKTPWDSSNSSAVQVKIPGISKLQVKVHFARIYECKSKIISTFAITCLLVYHIAFCSYLLIAGTIVVTLDLITPVFLLLIQCKHGHSPSRVNKGGTKSIPTKEDMILTFIIRVYSRVQYNFSILFKTLPNQQWYLFIPILNLGIETG